MKTEPDHFYAERVDEARNMARYYLVEHSLTLFVETCVTRTWGRIGQRGQTKSHFFPVAGDASDMAASLMRQKQGRGYVAR